MIDLPGLPHEVPHPPAHGSGCSPSLALTVMKVTIRVTHWGCWGSVAVLHYLGWEGFAKVFIGIWGGRNSTHWMDASHVSDSGLLWFQVTEGKRYLGGHLPISGWNIDEVHKVRLFSSSGLGTQLSRLGGHRSLYGQEHRAWSGGVLKQKKQISLVLSALNSFLGSCLWVRPHCKGHSLSLRTSQIKKQANQ